MADNEVIREKSQSFNLGIESSTVLGDIDAAEAFLSETVTAPAKEIEKATEEEIAAKKKIPEKKKDEDKKIDSNTLINNMLEKKEEDEEENLEEKEEETGEINHFEVFSKELYNLGSFTIEEGTDPVIAKTPEEFVQLFNEQKQIAATDWLEGFLAKHGEDRRELFEAIFINGVEPDKYLPVYNEIANFEGIDLEKEENQESVVRSYYSKMGWTKPEVDNKIEKLRQYADLEDESKKVHPKLVQQQKEKLEQIAVEAQKKEENKLAIDVEYKKGLSAVLQEKVKTKDFDGIPIDEKRAAKAFDFLYTKKWKTASGELLTDFDKFILETRNSQNLPNRIKVALLAIDNFDFSKIQKKAVSKESNVLFSSLVTKDVKQSNKKQALENDSWAKI